MTEPSAKEQATPKELALAHVELAKRILVFLVLSLVVSGVVIAGLWFNGTIRFRWDFPASRECPKCPPANDARVAAVPKSASAAASVPASATTATASPSAGISLENIPDAHAAAAVRMSWAKESASNARSSCISTSCVTQRMSGMVTERSARTANFHARTSRNFLSS